MINGCQITYVIIIPVTAKIKLFCNANLMLHVSMVIELFHVLT